MVKEKKFSLYFLQEVHSTNETEPYWHYEWGYWTIFTTFSSSRAGLSILFNNNFQFQILKHFADPQGRFIIADIDTWDKIMTPVNVYVPNKDNPAFLRNMRDKLSSFECDFVVFGGDFNLVCDVSKDKKGGVATTHLKSRDEVEAIREYFELADIWRVLNPEATHFMWRRENPEIQCRLVFFLISFSLCPEITEANIVPGYRTDHSMITFRISTAQNPRGPGYWKLNTHHQTETQYTELIRKTIADVCKEYEGQSEVDEILLLDVIKMKVREASLNYAAARKQRMENRENWLEEEVLALENQLDECNVSDKVKENIRAELRIKKQQIEEIITYKTQRGYS